MEQWYALRTYSGREESAALLLRRKANREYWSECRVLKKIKVFRSGGILHFVEDVMFPGYVFVKTDCPGKLAAELGRSKEFPQPLPCGGRPENADGYFNSQDMIALKPEDLHFLQSVCGENLQRAMGVTRIVLNGDNRIVSADGVLQRYLGQIVKLNLHKRFAVVEVELFNRRQPVLFGLQLVQDRAG